MNVTLFDIASAFIGERERIGAEDNPWIRWCHSKTSGGESPDEIAWCSSAVNGCCHILNLPRSKSKAARSWLAVGRRVPTQEARQGYDVVVLKRGPDPQPGADVMAAQGHVGLFSRWLDGGARVEILGGNQGNAMSRARFNADRILAVQRLWELL